MPVETYDALALKQYAFQLHKTNSFFSLATILISAAIVLVSILINFDTLSHIWLTRAQLPIMVTESIAYPAPLSDSLVCYKSNDNVTLPKARVLSQNLTELKTEKLSKEDATRFNPKLAQQIGSNFACFNLKNLEFSASSSIFIIEVFSKNATIYVSTRSEDSIISNSFEEAIPIQSAYATYMASYTFQILSATIRDTLFMGEEPQIINTFLKCNNTDLYRNYPSPFQSPNIKFGIALFSPITYSNEEQNFNILSVFITRFDIGYIVGTIISWISMLGLICSFILVPLMDYKYRLLQAETLFFIKPQLRNPSLIKFIIASYKKGVFLKEDYFVRLSGRVEELKNIETAIKTHKTVGKVVYLSSKPIQTEVIACEQSFAEPYSELENNHYADENTLKEAFFDAKEDQKKEGLIEAKRKMILRALDEGSDEISVYYSGEGHGTKASICLTILFAVGFVVFLITFGVFQVSKTTTVYTKGNLQSFDYTFAVDEIFFTSLFDSDYSIEIQDGNYEYLSTVPLLSGAQCVDRMKTAQITGIDFNSTVSRCLKQPLTLRYSSDPKEAIIIYFNLANLNYDIVYVNHNSYLNSIEEITPIDSFYTMMNLAGSDYFTISTLKIFQKEEKKTAQFMPTSILQTNALEAKPITGYFMKISEHLAVVETNVNTIFDVMQNVWSLATVCFAVMLTKISKYINLRQKDISMTKIRADFRENICILLSKTNYLLLGRHREELHKARHFMKEELCKGY